MNRLARMSWTLGAPVRILLIAVIRVYRVTLGGLLGGQCRFYPTCSVYAEGAIATHGAIRGLGLALWRIARCGPFTSGGVDHVPPAHGHGKYDDVTQVAA